MDQLINHLGKARYISTLDMTKGYCQVPLAAASQEKTDFYTQGGLYHYQVLPLGLHMAPATFQRLMDRILCPHPELSGRGHLFIFRNKLLTEDGTAWHL